MNNSALRLVTVLLAVLGATIPTAVATPPLTLEVAAADAGICDFLPWWPGC